MTRAAFFGRRVDANQAAVVRALRLAGAHVAHLYRQGEGCPDLLVGWRGRWFPVELKDGARPPSEQRLTPAETRWHAAALGAGLPVLVVTSAADALAQLGGIASPATRRAAATPNTWRPKR
jgi:hypothetical protein